MKKINLFLALLLAIITTGNYSQNLLWAKQFSGTGGKTAVDIVTDASGNVFTTGNFSGTVDFDPGPGTFTLTAVAFSGDIFVSKLDMNGNFLWVAQFGSCLSNFGNSVVTDPTGNVYIAGQFECPVDFDPGPGTYTLAPPSGGDDIFILKLDPSGNFIWVDQIGGVGYDKAMAIGIDPSNNIYITGSFQNTVDFDPGAGVYNLTVAGSTDIFVAKVNSNGNFVWANMMGGTGADQANGLAVDASGNVYTTGYFSGVSDFDPSPATYTLNSLGSYDIFFSKFNTSGNFVWTKQIGGTNAEQGYGIAVASSGNVFTTGYFNSIGMDFDPGIGTFTLSSNGGADVYINQLDPLGNFIWAKQIGGTTNDIGLAITLDALSNVYSIGYFASPTIDLDPGPGTLTVTNAGGVNDAYISILNSSGTFNNAIQITGAGNDSGRGITFDPSGNLILTGGFTGTIDLDPGPGSSTFTTPGSNGDVYICKFNNVVLGVNDQIKESIVKIIPNPNQGQFRIQLKDEIRNASVEIANVLGQIIYKENLAKTNNSIQLLGINKGIYFVKILENSKLIVTEKIVVE